MAAFAWFSKPIISAKKKSRSHPYFQVFLRQISKAIWIQIRSCIYLTNFPHNYAGMLLLQCQSFFLVNLRSNTLSHACDGVAHTTQMCVISWNVKEKSPWMLSPWWRLQKIGEKWPFGGSVQGDRLMSGWPPPLMTNEVFLIKCNLGKERVLCWPLLMTYQSSKHTAIILMMVFLVMSLHSVIIMMTWTFERYQNFITLLTARREIIHVRQMHTMTLLKAGGQESLYSRPSLFTRVKSGHKFWLHQCLLLLLWNSLLTWLTFFLQALCGARAAVPLIGSEERMVINLQDEVIKPSTVKRVVGKGLPNPKDPSRRGDLVVSFDIVFPERLSTTTRDLFRSHLPGKWIFNY